MYSEKQWGPTFGQGHDLAISNRCNDNSMSYSFLGETYEPPKGYTTGNLEARNLLAGSYDFICDEYEVFYQV